MKHLEWRPALPIAAAGVLIAAIVVTLSAAIAPMSDAPSGRRPYVNIALGDSPLSRLLAAGDGQFYYALARDPSLARPQDFGGAEEAAYRAQRPLLSYLAWGTSLGRPGALPFALATLVVISSGFAAGACTMLARELGAHRVIGLAVLALPGSLAVLRGPAGELLALGFAAAGVIAWRRRSAVACALLLTLAALARETTLIVPIALAAAELFRTRRWSTRSLALAAPLALWGTWIAIVRMRYGAWPSQTSSPRLGAPFLGLVDSAPRWDNPIPNLIVLGLGIAIVGGVLARRRRSPLATIVVAHAVLALVMGRDVWHAWENFARPLLPMYAFGLVALASPPGDLRPGGAGAGRRRRSVASAPGP